MAVDWFMLQPLFLLKSFSRFSFFQFLFFCSHDSSRWHHKFARLFCLMGKWNPFLTRWSGLTRRRRSDSEVTALTAVPLLSGGGRGVCSLLLLTLPPLISVKQHTFRGWCVFPLCTDENLSPTYFSPREKVDGLDQPNIRCFVFCVPFLPFCCLSCSARARLESANKPSEGSFNCNNEEKKSGFL